MTSTWRTWTSKGERVLQVHYEYRRENPTTHHEDFMTELGQLPAEQNAIAHQVECRAQRLRGSLQVATKDSTVLKARSTVHPPTLPVLT
jgi:hypothetical protein